MYLSGHIYDISNQNSYETTIEKKTIHTENPHEGSLVTHVPHFIGTPPFSESQDVGGGDPPPAHRGVEEHHMVPHLHANRTVPGNVYVYEYPSSSLLQTLSSYRFL